MQTSPPFAFIYPATYFHPRPPSSVLFPSKLRNTRHVDLAFFHANASPANEFLDRSLLRFPTSLASKEIEINPLGSDSGRSKEAFFEILFSPPPGN